MRRFTAIVNPAAGRAAGAAALIPLARALRGAGAQVEAEYSRGFGHAAALAGRAADAGRTVLAVGGDGMAGTVAGALAGTGAVCGLVPGAVGRNAVARALGLPRASEELAELLLHGEPRPVDVLRVAGAAPAVALGAVWIGAGAARTAAGRALASRRSALFRITVDGTPYEMRGHTVLVANAPCPGVPSPGSGPEVRLDDGALDVAVLGGGPGRPTRARGDLLRGRGVHVEADRPVPYAADGIPAPDLPLTARVLPAALHVLR
ncbi:diacylglycerol kinase family protein [Streptomyces sp. WMMC500]|uniref:diacylglycerol/lipid kinase family protein n=1 Tax=Streptomyces sp. WMMC500 TaxID=3015154 RepID=UPI00248BF997|nr:diacylglycerol kinase family protein [Streptomyces sp. WMMC500]WBB60512.1 diacylglycerol kinase family protein [Streptomyces sp. WMMC500]